MENEKNNANSPIKQCPTDYGNAMNFETLDGSQILREVLTDTYVTQSGNEDTMLKQLDKMVEYTYAKRAGFAGYLSWCYAQLTLLFLLERYEQSKKMLESMEFCVGCFRKYLMTGNYLDSGGKPTGFRNYSFGEPESEMRNTLQYANDCYQTARLVHKKSGSFESGYSFLVASMLYHTAVAETSAALEDCSKMEKLIDHIRKYIDSVIANPPETNIGNDGKDYTNFSEILKQGTKK